MTPSPPEWRRAASLAESRATHVGGMEGEALSGWAVKARAHAAYLEHGLPDSAPNGMSVVVKPGPLSRPADGKRRFAGGTV